MIDKPGDIWEILLGRLFAACRKLRDDAAEKAGQHPSLTRAITVTGCIAVFCLLVVGFAVPKEVTVYVDDSINTTETVYKTTARRVDTFLEAHGIEFQMNRDVMDAEYYDPIEDGMEIHITKEFRVELTADGKTMELDLLPCTVADVLKQQRIIVDSDDIVTPELEHQLQEGDHIVIQRVMKVLEKEEDITEYEVVYQADSSMTIGDTQVTQKGRNGIIEKTYKVTYVDGQATEKVLVSTETIKKKKDKIISYGTKIDISKPEGLTYEKKYENVRAVSYYFSGNPRGAYGLPCEFGTVAVDKDLIPLGSLLYIEGYGYAIANDVGTAIKGKTVDLYMEKYEQCLLWGARWTTVYVIDEAE